MKAKTRFLDSDWLKLAEETFKDSQIQVKELAALHDDRTEMNYALLTASTKDLSQASEDRIVERITGTLTAALMVRSNTEPVALTIIGDILCRWPSSSKGILLTPNRKQLVKLFTHDFQSAEYLAEHCGFKNADGVRQAIAKIKQKFCVTFSVADSFIEGKEGYGYRLADGYDLIDIG